MSCRFQKGGWKNATDGGIMDLIKFHNHYLEKANVFVDPSKISKTATSSLVVIDMQKDFVDINGAFSVAEGVQMEPQLVEFIKKNIENFTKVIFSRDSHDANHCSFKAFPPHCVINSEGGQLTEEMKKLVNDLQTQGHSNKLDVIFKGMFPKTDSFGALNYPANNYAPTRQVGDCDKHAGYLEETGGFYLNTTDTGKKFSDKPFDGGNTYEQIKNELKPEKFKVCHLFPGQKSGEHNVFIVGLAGDFCAKDTAINIAKQAQKGLINGVKVNVFVIQPFVRYPFVPIAYLPPDFDLNVFKAEGTNKALPYYAFEMNKTNGTKRLLSKEEIQTATPEQIRTFYHFLTDPAELVAHYTTSGVKILMTEPTFTGASTNVTTAASTNGAAATTQMTPGPVVSGVAGRQQKAFYAAVKRTRNARGLPGPTQGGKRRCKKMRTRKQRRHRK